MIDHIETFEWFPPEEPSQFAIIIPNQNSIHINSKLMEVLPERIAIGLGDDGRTMAIRANPVGFHPPKHGILKKAAAQILRRLLASGLRLPARYTVTKQGEMWIGVLDDPLPPVLQEKKLTRKARKKDLSGLIEEVRTK